MRKRFLPGLILAACLIPPVQAGWPVTVIGDIPGQLAQHQNMVQSLKDYAALLEQLDEMRRQFEQLEREYNAVTGARNLGDILNNPLLRQYLPSDWTEVYDNIRYGGYEGLSGKARALRHASKIIDSCTYIEDIVERRNCEALAVKPVQDQAFTMGAFDKSRDRVSQIESLMARINMTNDPKSIAELNARIGAEQALIQNEQTKLTLYAATARAEENVLLQQEREIESKYWNSTQHGNTVEPFRMTGW